MSDDDGGDVVDLVDVREQARERAVIGYALAPSSRRALLTAAIVAGPLLGELASRGNALAILRIVEALAATAHGNVTRALEAIHEVEGDYREPA